MSCRVKMLSSWDNNQPNFKVRVGHKNIVESQEKIGLIQIFMGRFLCLWNKTHDFELSTTSVAKTKHNSGLSWVRGSIKIIWKWVCKMCLERNKDRHGHEEAAKRERV